MTRDLCVGITTWNSALFLRQCLQSVRDTTDERVTQVEVLDNESTDGSVEIAREFGAHVTVSHCSQLIALNMLLDSSRARHTLLLHSDVILLAEDWHGVCSRYLRDDVALVSPEDIGCGPLTRPYGRGKPESCFLLFDTEKARRCKTWTWVRRRGLPFPTRTFHLEPAYVTHDLPATLARRGFTWKPMRVHTSPSDETIRYRPPFTPEYWSDSLGALRYAMGNFYSLDGVVTHYHNWFDRVPKGVPMDSLETTEGEGRGLPLAFLSAGTRRFLDDLAAGGLWLPSVSAADPQPAVTPRYVPDLGRPFDVEHAQPREAGV